MENKISPSCYVLFSKKVGKYYVGSTQQKVEHRLIEHLSGQKKSGFTNSAKDWSIVLIIECTTYLQAYRIEHHIKRMKSKTYIENLIRYPEMVEKLKLQYELPS